MPFAAVRLGIAAALLLVVGCLYPVHRKIDCDLCALTAQPVDLQPAAADHAVPMPPASESRPLPKEKSGSDEATANYIDRLTLTAHQAGEKKETPGASEKADQLKKRLEVPPELNLGQPPVDVSSRKYPPLPPLPADPEAALGPEGKPLTLSDLQRLARAHSPLLVQARANVEAARGHAIQAGLPPNPTLRFEQDTAGTTFGPGYIGGGIEQSFKTAGKLQLQRAVATMDLLNAELAYRRAQTDLITRVRSGYFSVLVAQENMRISGFLVRLVDTAYQIQARRASEKVGIAYPYEPLQLRAQALQARITYNTARQHYLSSWKQLAATLGMTGLPLTRLAGRIDIPVPSFHYDQILTRILQRHTDVLTADNTLLKSRYNLQLARVTPIPDVDVSLLVQKDFTGPPFNVVYSVVLGAPLPVWDRNQGGIIAAQANLIQSTEEAHRVRTQLTTSLATAYESYLTNLESMRTFRTGVIPDQLRAYEGLVNRYLVEGGLAPTVPEVAASLGFGDVANAQQVLIQYYAAYFTSLDALWQAVVSVADLLQTEDLFQAGQGVEMGEAPPCAAELERLPDLPCFHPCAPLPGGHQGADGAWPSGLSPKAPPTQPAAEGPKETTPTPAEPAKPNSPRPSTAPPPENPAERVPPPMPLRLRESSPQRTPAQTELSLPPDALPEGPRQTP